MTPEQFIAIMLPAAQAAQATTRIPAAFSVAEAALESGWGAHCPGNNLYGVKADASWHGPVVSECTREVIHGADTHITANFRAYPSWQASFEDHGRFLDPTVNPRYAPAYLTSTPQDFARAVAAAGYATDPNYADKIIQIMEQHHLV
jgi:flagellum-specific peptidoglycan hydrolase FlgJ